jgi:hypothetical protein
VSDGGGLTGFVRALARPTVIRTCTTCGYTWKLARYLSKAHFKGLPMNPGTGNLGAGGMGPQIAQVRGSNESMLSEVAQLRVCANCQSESYSQKRVWHMSKAEYKDAVE